MKLLIRLVCKIRKNKQKIEERQIIYRYTGMTKGKKYNRRGKWEENGELIGWPVIVWVCIVVGLWGICPDFSGRERHSRFWDLLEAGMWGYFLGQSHILINLKEVFKNLREK